MRGLLALLLASVLGATAAHAGEPACGETSAALAPGHEEPPGDGCGDCGDACVDCACCRAPLAVAPRAARPAPPAAWAALAADGAPLEGVRPASDIFQPPRA